ncbi:MAG: shikimate kinase [Candidatus Limivivens sp.]|nr:shikimate kinase [Candidatus Limivivens sp.]
MKNIVLIGFMGAGKSTVAEAFHRTRGMEVVEMDARIAENEGMTIPEIFREKGEPYFRDLETGLLVELQKQENVVISCGGGVPLRERNVAEMKKNGTVIWLAASARTILERVKDSHDRPLLEGNKNLAYIENMLESRREKYEAAADLIIWTDGKTAEQICEEIVEQMKRQGGLCVG